MKQDIKHPEVRDIAIAIVPESNELNEQEWSVYFINMKNSDIEGVLVNASGIGEIMGRKKETATLSYFLDEVKASSFRKVENILAEAFQLTNRYWVSFYENKIIHDKKYIFVPESISERNFVNVPILNKRGVMIR